MAELTKEENSRRKNRRQSPWKTQKLRRGHRTNLNDCEGQGLLLPLLAGEQAAVPTDTFPCPQLMLSLWKLMWPPCGFCFSQKKMKSLSHVHSTDFIWCNCSVVHRVRDWQKKKKRLAEVLVGSHCANRAKEAQSQLSTISSIPLSLWAPLAGSSTRKEGHF